MKNIINEVPSKEIHGRTLYSCNFIDFIDYKNKDLLDIGCGYGWFELKAIDKDVNSIVGIEPTAQDLKTANRHVKHPKVNFKVGSAIDLPFNDNAFDTVIAWETIEHIPRNAELKMFREVYRVLRTRGSFYLSTPCNYFFSKLFDPAWWLIGHRHYNRQQLKQFAQQAGFMVEKIVLKGKWWEIIGINNLYISKWMFRRKPFFENFISRKMDKEYQKQKGFTNIFIKFKKF